MKRSAMPRRKTRIKPQSQRGAEYEAEYQAQIPVVNARSAGRCEILAAHDCDGVASPRPHHRKFRSQGGSNSVDNLLNVCWTGHNWIHRILPREWAEAFDLIVPREDPEHAYRASEG